MDFNYSEEQQMLADSLRRFVDSEYTFERRRKACRDGAMDRAAWRTLGEMGVLGLTIDAEHGGFGESPASQLVVHRELGRGLVAEPVLPSAVCAATILSANGNGAQKSEWLPALASGERIVTLAYLEADSRYRTEAVRTTARRTSDGFVLDGAKALAWHGDAADAFLVSARTVESSGSSSSGEDDTSGISLFLVPAGSTGLRVTGYPTMDRMRAADLVFDGVALPADALVGQAGAGLAALTHGIGNGIAAQCAQAAGAIEKLIDITAEYLRTRQQFGKPLATFQALQHRMADMLVQKELALSMAYVAAQALDESDPVQRQRMLCAAKIIVAKAGRFVGQQAVQLHGGMGMTDELEVGDYFKRLTMTDVVFGDSDYQMELYVAAA